MSPVYSEDIMRSLGYFEKNINLCPVTENIQPRCMLFKTNYRSTNEAKSFIDKLEESIKTYKGFNS